MQIVVPDVKANLHAHAFDEIVRTLVGGLCRLGIACSPTTQLAPTGEQAIVVAPHLYTPSTLAALPRDTILYTWEPIGALGARHMDAEVQAMMSEFVVWDYSAKNLEEWHRGGAARTVHVPLGYDPSLRSLTPALPEPDVDVLFYGSVNERRAQVLQELKDRGVVVGTMFGGYGLERDAAIARSRLVLNLHFYESGILELPRLSYLWANRKPVLCEINPATEVPFDLRGVVSSAPYDGLVEETLRLLADPAAMPGQAERTFEHFSVAGDAATILSGALEATRAMQTAGAR